MSTAAIYARVSTNDQDVRRQVEDAWWYLEEQGFDEIKEFPEVVSGTSSISNREVYDEVWHEVATGRFEVVVVHEISRLSRMGATEIHEFIQHCLEQGTGVEAMDVGLVIHVDDLFALV